MKKINLCSVSVWLLAFAIVTCSSAAPIGNSNHGRDYLVGSSSLNRWSTGVFGGLGERALSGGGMQDMDYTRGVAFLGYDVLRWVTAYATVGIHSVKFNGTAADESRTETGLGLHFNLLDHEIMDPTLIEDRIRLNADVSMGFYDAEWMGRAYDWRDLAANMTVGIVNDLDGHPYYLPESIVLYAGPAYSTLESDDFSEEETLGFIIGLEVFLTKRVAFDVSITKLDSPIVMGSANIRF